MGLAARFTAGLGLATLLFALPASWLLLSEAARLNEETASQARQELAATTNRMRREAVALPPQLRAQEHGSPDGSRVLVAQEKFITSRGEEELRVFRLIPRDDPEGREALNLFAPAGESRDIRQRLIVLVALVTGGMVLVVIVLGALTARRVAAPLQAMIEDVQAISHGRFSHRVRTENASAEVAHLGRSIDRMVRDLVEGQEVKRDLEKRQREVEVLRELRRNLQPMTQEAPPGYSLETLLVEAQGAGTGDFVDALRSAEGAPTLVVGATAERGLPGALLMAMTRAYLRGAILNGAAPAEACELTNASLNRDLARGLYASAMVARLDPATGVVELVSAGHKAPAVRWDSAAQGMRKLQPNGIALGFDQGPVFRRSLEALTLELRPGDALFLFSPDAFECQNAAGRKLGESGVYALAKTAIQDGMEAMRKKLQTFLGGRPLSDLAFAVLRSDPWAAEEKRTARATQEVTA